MSAIRQTDEEIEDFSSARREIKFRIDGRAFVAREFGGDDLEKFQTETAEKVVIGPDGQPRTITDAGGIVRTVLVLSLFRLNDSGQYEKVTKEWIGGLPASLSKKLFDLAARVNGLNQEGGDEAKKVSSPGQTATGSESPKSSSAEPSAS